METMLLKQIPNQQASASTSAMGAKSRDHDDDDDDDGETNKVVHFASHAEVKIDPQAGQDYPYAVDDVMEDDADDVDAIEGHQIRQDEQTGSRNEPELPFAPPAPLQENGSSQFTMSAEVVTGLTQPMNPFLRRRREFLEGTAKSSFRLPRIKQDHGKRNLMERPQYRLTSRTVRTYKRGTNKQEWNEPNKTKQIVKGVSFYSFRKSHIFLRFSN
jgi:hypothetical protein